MRTSHQRRTALADMPASLPLCFLGLLLWDRLSSLSFPLADWKVCPHIDYVTISTLSLRHPVRRAG